MKHREFRPNLRRLWTRAVGGLTLLIGIGLAVVAEAAPFAYVTNYDTVSVIDTQSNTVVATVPVGAGAAGVAITPDGAFAYVANLNSRSVSVIDIGTNTVATSVAMGPVSPYGVAITPDGAFVYVTNFLDNTVSVAVTATSTVVSESWWPAVSVA
jgi:YVTN family beta-propeller protein